jgi:hypothetical protein
MHRSMRPGQGAYRVVINLRVVSAWWVLDGWIFLGDSGATD